MKKTRLWFNLSLMAVISYTEGSWANNFLGNCVIKVNDVDNILANIAVKISQERGTDLLSLLFLLLFLF